MWQRAWVLSKTAVFTLVMPGTIAGYVPYGLTRATPWESPPIIVWCAAVPILALGVSLYLWCVWRFAADGLGTPAPIDPPKTLVVRGPYRVTRNPMYVAVLAVITGEALLMRSTMLAQYGVAVFAGFFLFVIGYEEPTLSATFGSAYDAYRAAVPRWIPWRRRGSRRHLPASVSIRRAR